MAVQIQSIVGPQVLSDGTLASPRLGKAGEQISSMLHGRFYEQNYRQALYGGGIASLTSISNATFTTGTLGATCTPCAGLWNPITSTVSLVVIQVVVSMTITSLTNTGGAPFSWAFSVGNNVISTGNTPWNRKTLAKFGSQAKDMSGVALTGLTNNLVVAFGSAMSGGSCFNANVGTAAGFQTIHLCAVENVDGSIIVPPGGVIALLATSTPQAHSATSQIFWEEVPI